MQEDFIDWIRKVPIFKELRDQALNPIIDLCFETPFEPEEVIFNANEPADALYIIKSGNVRIEQAYRDGRKKTLAVLTSSNFFGEMALITSEKRCATAISSDHSQLIKLEKDTFLSCLQANAEACFGIMQVICKRLQTADKEISNLTFQNLPGRIAYKLLELSEQFGRLDEFGLTIQLSLTHYDLADMVGTNRESVSKFLTKFKKEGSISVQQKKITILDKHKLLSWT
jgi:CRP/FNR family transcriptional regulator